MRRAAWAAVIVLIAVGVSSALFRAVSVVAPDGAMARFERRSVQSLNHDEALIHQFDARFTAHPAVTLWHVVPGALFLAAAPLQFSRRIRARHLRFHRWSGRVLAVTAIGAVIDSFYFGILHPFAGFGEASAIAVFGALMLVAVVRGFVTIRRGDQTRHRQWMIRAFATALGIATIRIIGTILQAWVEMPPAQMLTVSFWAGWTLTLAAAELYIRAIATSVRTYSSPVRGIGSATR